METFVCQLCDWVGTPEPCLVPRGGAGGIEFLPLQPGGVKPRLYALEIVMDDTTLIRVGNFETQHHAEGWGLWFHNAYLMKGHIWHCRVRAVRDYAAADTHADLCVGRNEWFAPA
ncbi:hypothetical protein CRM90_27955 [Mycobacterium sp. ENV421]|uniref:hypothetical protein n=1 Tax=Mycobacterium sp. ENV421 TaxID=1213407 RepID=UPI000C9AA674|nr:hypothetical protein [Mycobacterium sp. ENV421]PND54437.1 hypothetical protein CRM90_27955 [Mycobacterium sp. ENV421]